MKFIENVRARFHRKMDQAGNLDPGAWVYIIIVVVVLFALIAGLYDTFYDNVSTLGNVTGNPFGDAFGTIVILLLFAGLLLAVVGAFLAKAKLKGA